MERLRKYYWDACVWIDLITQSDEDRFKRCLHVLSEVEKHKAELWTSAFTLAEVYKRKCDGDTASMPEDQDDTFESYFESGLVKPILVDVQVAKVSRRLCRKYPGLRKPQDAIHVASCVIGNIDELGNYILNCTNTERFPDIVCSISYDWLFLINRILGRFPGYQTDPLGSGVGVARRC